MLRRRFQREPTRGEVIDHLDRTAHASSAPRKSTKATKRARKASADREAMRAARADLAALRARLGREPSETELFAFVQERARELSSGRSGAPTHDREALARAMGVIDTPSTVRHEEARLIFGAREGRPHRDRARMRASEKAELDRMMGLDSSAEPSGAVRREGNRLVFNASAAKRGA